jgi:hypothetical protein
MSDTNRDWHSATQATATHAPHPPVHYKPIDGELWAVIGFAACFWLFVLYRLSRDIYRLIGWIRSHE